MTPNIGKCIKERGFHSYVCTWCRQPHGLAELYCQTCSYIQCTETQLVPASAVSIRDTYQVRPITRRLFVQQRSAGKPTSLYFNHCSLLHRIISRLPRHSWLYFSSSSSSKQYYLRQYDVPDSQHNMTPLCR